jgi:hypothetical protein
VNLVKKLPREGLVTVLILALLVGCVNKTPPTESATVVPSLTSTEQSTSTQPPTETFTSTPTNTVTSTSTPTFTATASPTFTATSIWIPPTSTPVRYCGDGVCYSGESLDTCPIDCGTYCGDGVCIELFGEGCSTCPSDCGVCAPSPYLKNPVKDLPAPPQGGANPF